jgi:hypothetical protein
MITVVELPEYIRKSERLLDAEERDNVLEHIARNPCTGKANNFAGKIIQTR